ncbi:MAG TPA: tetratricopeptide repeat protein [Xanthobacteraceae bacterium]|nr:tetratricopeptide repeat protein [Xanthobacteraceae bacterium]
MWRGTRAALIGLGLFAVGMAMPVERAAAQNVKADVSVNTSAGYARVVFNFAEDVESSVRLSSSVLIVSFRRPVDVSVDRIANSNEYFSAARRDPDGRGIRIALNQRVRVNSMVAGERLFIDLMPDSWTAAPPSLPQEVIEDLSKRMRAAEKRARDQQALERERVVPTSRVRVSRQPTFTRYIFELPELIAVNTERENEKLTLIFGSPLKFDLADAKVMQPQVVESVQVTNADTSAAVLFSFVGNVDVRTFREDNNYVVDVLSIEPGKPEQALLAPPKVVEPPPGLPPPVMQSEPVAGKPNIKPEEVQARAPAVSRMTANAPSPAPAAEEKRETAAQTPAQPAVKAVDKEAEEKSMMRPVPEADVESRPPPEPAPQATSAGVTPTIKRQGDGFQLGFKFGEPTPMAAFVRADSLWLVFDTNTNIDLPGVRNDSIRGLTVDPRYEFQVVRLKLDRPRLISVAAEDNAWTVDVGDVVAFPAQPIALLRSVVMDKQASVQVPMEGTGNLRRIDDPEIGDELAVVTSLGPPRNLPRAQEFVDFNALASVHGLIIQLLADDLSVEVVPDRVWIGRPKGLTLTSSSPTGRRGSLRPTLFDSQQWGFDRQAEFPKRQLGLINAAAHAAETKRHAARLDLARFYFARDMYPEAKAVLDVALQDERPTAEDTTGLVMRGVAKIFMNRPEDALKDLNLPIVGNQNDAPLWRALAAARQGKWPEAREGLRKSETSVAALPIELQREIFKDAIRASIEVNDYATADSQLRELEALGATSEMADLEILTGRIREGLGENPDALTSYRTAAESQDRSVSAQGQMRDIALRFRLGELKRADVLSGLETLTAIWRGDETEAEALQLLAQLYIEDGRYRDAFNLMRIALRAHPNSDLTRRIQDNAATAFDNLFLGGKGDSLPAIDALSLFYDFRELTPIGRRGDEMIRRLADRLMAVDLLDQSAELLQHQVDHRLQGAARAQVAIRLAVIHLLNRKPERALQALKSTRLSDLSRDIRNQRLMLEARALSDVGRHGLAVDVAQNIAGPEAARLRSDILWAAKRYRESAEEIENLYDGRRREWTPLNDVERRDILRAGMSYAIADDTLGLERFREKFAPVMAQGPEREAFDIVTAPFSASKPEFAEIVKSIAAVDTLMQFVRDMRARYPDAAPAPAASAAGAQSRQQKPDPSPTGALGAVVSH